MVGGIDLEPSEANMFGLYLVYQAMKKVKVIRDRLKAAQSC